MCYITISKITCTSSHRLRAQNFGHETSHTLKSDKKKTRYINFILALYFFFIGFYKIFSNSEDVGTNWPIRLIFFPKQTPFDFSSPTSIIYNGMVYVLQSFVGRRQHCLTTIVDWWRSSLATYNSQCPKKE